MPTIANIINGKLVVYTAVYGEALPELDNLMPPAVTVTPAGNWSQVPFTVDDYIFKYEPEFEEVFVNEHNGAVELLLIKEAATLELTFSENDMSAWNRAISASTLGTQAAGADQTAQDQLGVGDKASTTAISLLLLGTSPEAGSRVIHCYKVKQTGSFEHVAGKKQGMATLTYTLLTDTSKTAGERMFKVWDITAVASS